MGQTTGAIGVPAFARSSGPQRPGWWWTLGTLFLAGLCSIPLVALEVGALVALGIVPAQFATVDAASSSADGLSASAWPWLRDGLWATAAGIWPQLLHGAAFALAFAFVARRRGGWRARPWPLIVAFAVVAPGPLAGGEGGGAFWLILWVVARQWGLTREPAGRRWSTAWRAAAAVAGAVLAVATLTYQPLHPFSAEGSPSAARTISFRLSVEGKAGARLLALRAGEEPLGRFGSLVVRLDDPAVRGRRLAAGTDVAGQIVMPRRWCTGGNYAELSLESITARVAVLGVERTQRIPLREPARIGCARAR